MAMKPWVKVIHSTAINTGGGWQIQLHFGQFFYEDGSSEYGYRFMYVDPKGYLKGYRGQARIPHLGIAMQLMSQAIAEGWGNLDETGKRILTAQQKHSAIIRAKNEAAMVVEAAQG